MNIFSRRHLRRRITGTAEVRILGGLPILASYQIHPPEPDVGIFHEQIEILNLEWLGGRTLPDKILGRLTRADYEQLEADILENLE